MVQCIRLVLVILTLASVTGAAISADEVTMRLRGAEQEFSGKLMSFDGKIYVIETPLFGEMNFDVSRFECVSGPCVPPGKKESITSTSTDDPAPSDLTRKRQIELFEGFRDWNNFQTFLEWRKSNAK